MEHAGKTKKVVAELAMLLVEGDERLQTYRRTLARWRWASVAFASIAVVIAVFPPDAIAIAAAILGMIGGACAGIVLIYESSLLTWPIVRQLLDEAAVQRFISENRR